MGANSVAISPDDYVLICVFWKKLITLWNLESLTLLTPMRCHDDIQSIECVSSDTNVDQLLIATAHVLLKCDHRTAQSSSIAQVEEADVSASRVEADVSASRRRCIIPNEYHSAFGSGIPCMADRHGSFVPKHRDPL